MHRPKTPFVDARAQLVYNILCDTDDCPPKGEHWEGWIACRIIDALASYDPCPNHVNCRGECFQCIYFNNETQRLEYPTCPAE